VKPLVVGLALVSFASCTRGGTARNPAAGSNGTSPAVVCPVTRPSGSPPPATALLNFGVPLGDPNASDYYGNGSLWTSLGNWVSAPDRDAQTGLISVKIPWFRAEPGQVQVSGHPLGGGSSTFTADVGTVPEYGPTGFVPSGLEFGRPGCWQLTAALNGSQLVLVVEVLPPAS
jgi:hypothetical protein